MKKSKKYSIIKSVEGKLLSLTFHSHFLSVANIYCIVVVFLIWEGNEMKRIKREIRDLLLSIIFLDFLLVFGIIASYYKFMCCEKFEAYYLAIASLFCAIMNLYSVIRISALNNYKQSEQKKNQYLNTEGIEGDDGLTYFWINPLT